MFDSPVSSPKNFKGPRPEALQFSGSIFRQNSKLDGFPNSPFTTSAVKHGSALSPIISAVDAIDLFRSNTTPQLFPMINLSQEDKTPLKTKNKISLDEKTLRNINKLVEYRQEGLERTKDKSNQSEWNKSEHTSAAQAKYDAIVQNINHYIKAKGLAKKPKDKLFNNTFQVFGNVKTFVDARKIFKEVAEDKLAFKKSSSVIENKDSGNILDLQKDSEYSIIPSSPNRQFSSTDKLQNLGPRSPTGKTMLLGNVGLLPEVAKNKSSRQMKKKGNKKEEEARTQEIRKLYFQLKDNAISKFGPEIFENIQDKLKDPECLRAIAEKRKNDLQVLRETQQYGGFYSKRNMIDLLSNDGKVSDNLQEDSSNKFQTYLNQELCEDTSYFYRSSSLPKSGFLFEKGGITDEINTEIPERVYQKPEDPQIKLFREMKDFKNTSNEVLRVLHNKIKKTTREKEEQKSLNNSTLDQSKLTAASPNSSKLTYKPSGFGPQADEQNDTIKPQDDLKRSATKSVAFFISQMGADEGTFSDQVNKSEKAKMSGSSRTKFFLEKEESKRKLRQASTEARSPNQTSQGFNIKPLKGLRANSQAKFSNLSKQLEEIAISNKELNKELKASMKKMEEPYSNHLQKLNQFEMPESLLSSRAPDYFQSSSRMASNLATRMVAQTLRSNNC